MHTQHVRTSGAYVLYNGLFPFQVGPTRKGDKLGVVRLGGHREGDEKAIQTAEREVLEESSMKINIINSPITFYKRDWNHSASKIRTEDEIAPILIKGSDPDSSTAMYLAHSESEPRPSSETSGLLLLTPKDVHLICKQRITLNDYLNQHGRALFKRKLNKNLLLEPFPQLQFLAELFENETELMMMFMAGRGIS
ncbi:NUDIX hydrolase [Mesobacillus subterraneus]|uniref:NUDIX hydrolase n=1 Tax=Mesobacillus subterraneus TaxID=285983 RepID=UPI00203D6C70|nr:NUDIX hydrolase [Mesobacillus subterraneus]MCM3666133.1 NUDIX hydrolase [Mesobacillus subterraneus]MCM3685131.1 NUDIX hydrolase [Mesobacillus subterraneus]